MSYQINFIAEALSDMKKLDHSIQPQVAKGIRVVYSVEEHNGIMNIIVISVRADNQVYEEAAKRRTKHDL